MSVVLSRRYLLTGLIAAPAVIGIDRLMPVRSIAQFLVPQATIIQSTINTRSYFKWWAPPGGDICGTLENGKSVSVYCVDALPVDFDGDAATEDMVRVISVKRRGTQLEFEGSQLMCVWGFERDTGRNFQLDCDTNRVHYWT